MTLMVAAAAIVANLECIPGLYNSDYSDCVEYDIPNEDNSNQVINFHLFIHKFRHFEKE